MTYELKTTYDARQSFYGKAIVKELNNKKYLISYKTKVCLIDEKGEVHLLKKWDYSATTLRHVREFLKQNNKAVYPKSKMKKYYND